MDKKKLYQIIFEADTRAGKIFDIVLLWMIIASIVVVMMESVATYGGTYPSFFRVAEWIFTILFTLEYLLRILVSKKPLRYALSFWGIVDLLAFLPGYLSLFISGYHYLLVIRIFRLLRIFRVFKLVRYSSEAQMLIRAMRASLYKISVFLLAVLTVVVIIGTLMYAVEGEQAGFSSIPQSIYWAIVTITTVGYGDIVPQTVLGKMIASLAMITGYAIIAVPTGIVTMEMSRTEGGKRECPACGSENPIINKYCRACGKLLG